MEQIVSYRLTYRLHFGELRRSQAVGEDHPLGPPANRDLHILARLVERNDAVPHQKGEAVETDETLRDRIDLSQRGEPCVERGGYV